jgi:hypothetical protein
MVVIRPFCSVRAAFAVNRPAGSPLVFFNDAAGLASRYRPLSRSPNEAFDGGLRPDPFPDRAASLLPACWQLPGPDLHRQATTSL